MPDITVSLQPETRQKLLQKATQRGETLESYIERVLDADARAGTHPLAGANGVSSTRAASQAAFDRRLDDLTVGLPPLPPLPADLSRAVVHGERD